MFKKLSLILVLALFGLSAKSVLAQYSWADHLNDPDNIPVYYWNLSKANVVLSPSESSGYVWKDNQWKKVSNGYAVSKAIHYILLDPDGKFNGNPDDATFRAQFPAVTTTSGGELNIVDNTDVAGVINAWNEVTNRPKTQYRVSVSCNSGYTILLDNIWSTYQIHDESRDTGGLGFQPKKSGAYCNVILRGDNRLGNVFYTSNSTCKLIFTSFEGIGATSGTLTVADLDPVSHETYSVGGEPLPVTHNHYCAVIGGNDNSGEDANGIYFNGGTVWAGALTTDNCSAIGAGGNGFGAIDISGGVVTAVTSSTGTAIGGGIGWTDHGGKAEVTISGGEVYAYNFGFAANYGGKLRYVPATAIGGGSSFLLPCDPCTVNISGGKVYAESIGGVCIGGGGSGLNNGGNGTVNITGGEIVAKSLPGTVYNCNPSSPVGASIEVPAGAGIGGGTGGTNSGSNGGNSTINISAGTLRTGSVGGGKTNNSSGKIGSATVHITGGDIKGQFVMAGGATAPCSFTMENGIIHNCDVTTAIDDFYFLKEDGGALWMDDSRGVGTITGGTITGCKAAQGGAIYMTGGTFSMSNASITNNIATKNGGAAYLGGGNATVTSGLIENNQSNENGGAMYIIADSQNGTVNIGQSDHIGVGPTFTNNRAGQNGGAMYIAKTGTGSYDVNYNFYGGLVDGNKALGTVENTGDGGAFYIRDAKKLTIQGGTIINNRSWRNGGAFAVYGGALTVKDGVVGREDEGNLCGVNPTNINETNLDDGKGGAFYIEGCSVDIQGGSIDYNRSCPTHTDENDFNDAGCGGAFYIINADLTMSGTEHPISICHNKANDEGGAFYVWANEDNKDVNVTLNEAEVCFNHAVNYGGAGCIYGDWAKKSKAIVDFNGANVSSNRADNNSGGGLYMTEYVDFTLTSGNLCNNTAKSDGGGLYISDTFEQNPGLYASGSVTFEMVGGMIKGNESEEGCGGGAYIESREVENPNEINIASVNVLQNKAKGHGGGIYIIGDANQVNFSSGIFRENLTTNGNGGAIAMHGGNMTLTNGNMEYNRSLAGFGGGLALTNGAHFTMSGGDINNNDALMAGGGVYADGAVYDANDALTGAGGMLKFMQGKIRQNRSRNGGGVYATRGVQIELANRGNIVTNYAYCGEGLQSPATAYHDNEGNQGIGGGVYLGSGINAGGDNHRTSLTFTTSSKDETAAPGLFDNLAYYGADDIYVSGLLTDITLPDIDNKHFSDFDGHATGWYEDYVNKDTEYTTDGVNFNPTPSGSDPRRYRASRLINANVYEITPITYTDKYLCMTIGYEMNTWVTMVHTDPNEGHENEHYVIDDGTYRIKTEQGLAWYISYITGYNFQKTKPSCTKAVLENDLDMSQYIWVPIGNNGSGSDGSQTYPLRTFQGEFDGQGHTIKGLWNMNLAGDAGMFGMVENGSVKNTFVTGSDFIGMREGYYGIIADTVSNGSVFNCEGAGTLTASMTYDNTTIGGVVGLLQDNASAHSCIATAELNGYKLGGLVGKVSAGSSFKNSFSNVRYSQYGSGEHEYHAGGLADENCGTIANCYVRFERENSLPSMPLSMFANSNSGTISACYLPEDMAGETLIKTGNAPESYASYSPVNTPYLYSVTDYNTVTPLSGSSISGLDTKSLLNTLNNWVTAKGGNYAQWQRTTAGGYTEQGGEINDDLPVHKFADFTSVGSDGGIKGGIVLTYGDLHTELSRKNEAEDGGTVMLYANDEETSLSNNDNVILYIGEDVSLIHKDNKLTAYTCQTMTKGSETWHNISSSLKQSPIGIKYGITSQVPWVDDVIGDINNPCDASILGDDELSLFPSDAPISSIDLYSFYEPQYHWINLKRNNLSHWHMDNHEQNITYTEDDNLMAEGASYLIPGKGYLAAIDKEVLLQNHGELNSGDVTVKVSNQAPEDIDRKGLNLLGNPYQSYLDFGKFVNENPTIFGSKAEEASYLVFDAKSNAYCQYKSGSSKGSMAASQYINMHQGFFIHYDGGTTATAKFTNDMRVKDAEGVSFRDWKPEYALVNLTVRNEQGQGDIAVVELGRPVTEGALKMKDISSGDAKVSFSYDGEDYGVLFLGEDVNELPVRFECEEGNYTMTWSTANAEFSYLHLIDNLTGMDVDMLTSEGYTFYGSADDYKSRFKMVFAYTGIEENDGTDTEAGETFAFLSNGELIVNGQGSMQLMDVNGQVVFSTRLTDSQSRVSIPEVAAGLYLIRLNEKVQKIVIR